MGMTMAEKVLAKASERDVVLPGQFVTANIDILMGHDRSFYAGYQTMINNGYHQVWDPDKIVVINDHAVPAPTYEFADVHRQIREWVKTQKIRNFYDCGVGICHQVLPEFGHALPGRLIVGGDSHTTTYGALGTASAGIGISDFAYVLAKGSLWFKVPETIRFILNSELSAGVSAKDVFLKIAGDYTAEVAQYKAIEFSGVLAKALSIDGRMTISNMGVEIGAKFAFFEADQKTLEYLKERTDEPAETFGPDPDAAYEAIHRVDISQLEPQVALPHNPGNVKPVSEVGEVQVDQAYLGSCTNGRLEDLAVAARILEGRKVNSKTRLFVTPASHRVMLEATKKGYTETLLEAGAHFNPASCGACCGGHLGLLAPGENCISSTNRNFRGRMGSPESQVFLGSPATVAASAITGRITDPREYWTETTLK